MAVTNTRKSQPSGSRLMQTRKQSEYLCHGEFILVNLVGRLVRRIDSRLVPASIFFYLLCFLDLTNIVRLPIFTLSLMLTSSREMQRFSTRLPATILNRHFIYRISNTWWSSWCSLYRTQSSKSRLATYSRNSNQAAGTMLYFYGKSILLFNHYLLYVTRFAFLMFAWGSCTMLVGVVKNFAGLAILRFLLALFEAGLFPGIVYSLTFWYKQDERAIRIALILGGATLGTCIRFFLWRD